MKHLLGVAATLLAGIAIGNAIPRASDQVPGAHPIFSIEQELGYCIDAADALEKEAGATDDYSRLLCFRARASGAYSLGFAAGCLYGAQSGATWGMNIVQQSKYADHDQNVYWQLATDVRRDVAGEERYACGRVTPLDIEAASAVVYDAQAASRALASIYFDAIIAKRKLKSP